MRHCSDLFIIEAWMRNTEWFFKQYINQEGIRKVSFSDSNTTDM